MSIGERLRAARRERNMSLADLARATHLSKGFISQIENGLSNPSLASLKKLVEALDLPTGGLFGSGVDDAATRETPLESQESHSERRSIRVFSPKLDGSDGIVPIITGGKQGTAALLTLPAHGTIVARQPEQPVTGTSFCAVLLGAIRISRRGVATVVRQGEVAAFDPSEPYELRSASGSDASLFLSLPRGCHLPVRTDIGERPRNTAPRMSATGPMRLVEMRRIRDKG